MREHDRVTDEELVERARRDPDGPSGEAAVSELFNRYREQVYLWCFRRVRDHEIALDLAQDVLVTAYRSLSTYERRARYSSWLFAIARNRCYRALRRPALLQDDSAEADSLPARGNPPDLQYEEERDEESLLSLIREELEEREQAALWLRCFENVPVEEITRLLGIPVSTGARGVLQSARRKLRAALEKDRSRGGAARAGPAAKGGDHDT